MSASQKATRCKRGRPPVDRSKFPQLKAWLKKFKALFDYYDAQIATDSSARGRAARAERACMEKFHIGDERTVRRHLAERKKWVESAGAIRTVVLESMNGIEALLEEIAALEKTVRKRQLLSETALNEMGELSPRVVLEILRAVTRS